MTEPRPRCPTCRHPLTRYPAECRCGHPDSSHHVTPSGRLTYCCHGDQAGPCSCVEYAEARAERYGPLPEPATE